MDNIIIRNLISVLPKNSVKLNEPMKEHTTFRIGGNAEVMIFPESTDDIKNIIKIAKDEDIPVFILGNGSNLLVCDEGIEGIVIKLDSNFSSVRVEGNDVYAASGTHLSKIANVCLENSLSGFEFASGIPGTLGGAIKMNAGAYGGEMKDVVKSAECIDMKGNIFTLTKEELDFSYRHSAISDYIIVLSAHLRLNEGEKTSIKETMRDLNSRRKEKQPLEYPSAGSTFKRPEGYFAGKLIQDSGLKGYTVGGAQVSEKHCGFVINKDSATFKDVMTLIQDVKNIVFDKFGVELCEEVKIIKRKEEDVK